jgi:hypothetical protein
MGCYSSALIDPAGNEREKMYTMNIERIVTKGGIEYTFDSPAVADSSVITGIGRIYRGKNELVTIPAPKIAQVYAFNSKPGEAILYVLLIVGLYYFVALASFHIPSVL